MIPSQSYHWRHNGLFTEVDTAYEWHVDWDRWQALSQEAKEIMVAYVDSRNRMQSFNNYVQNKEMERRMKAKH